MLPGESGKCLLLVDDEEAVRAAIRLMLQAEGYAVVSAGNGEEALGLFAQGRFHLVITDFTMPRMHGDELARRIKRLAPHQPILMITGCGRRIDDAEIDALLEKPFSLPELRTTIKRLAS